MSDLLQNGCIDWRAIADELWDGKTVQQACISLSIDYREVYREMDIEMRTFLLDVAMLANYRDGLLSAYNSCS